jgi:hypothetical protein
MSVFLRWGVFGIFAVGALLYAYNASKRLSEQHAGQAPPAVAAESSESGDDATEPEPDEEQDAPTPVARADSRSGYEAEPEMPAPCAEEQRVAERALKMRRDGDTLDHLLRIDTIVFQSDEPRRDRLRAVATQWFEREGRDPDAATLRAEALRDCRTALAALEQAGPRPADPEPASRAP